MSLRYYQFEYSGSLGEIAVEDEVIDRVDDEWREQLYELWNEFDIVQHLVHNLINNNSTLSQLDGWADLPDSYAQITKWPDAPEAQKIIRIK